MKKKNNNNQQYRHCPEVEELMGGKMPFVTRYGITLVFLIFITLGAILLLSKGPCQQLMQEILEHTIEHIKSKL